MYVWQQQHCIVLDLSAYLAATFLAPVLPDGHRSIGIRASDLFASCREVSMGESGPDTESIRPLGASVEVAQS